MRNRALRDVLLRARAAAVDQIAEIDRALAAMGKPTDPRLGRKTADAIQYVLEQAPSPLGPAAVWRTLTDAGRDVEPAAVHQAMHRMATRGRLVQIAHGLYTVPGRG